MSQLIRPDGSTENLLDNLTFSKIQELVGGYVETVPCINGTDTMCINEDGKLQNLHVNPEATALADIFGDDFIAGNAITLSPDEASRILN